MTSKSQRLCTNELSVAFGGLIALSDVNCSVSVGEVLGLIGPNGAGKTTLINCLTGFQKPTAGHVLIDGISTKTWAESDFRARGVSRTFQGGRLFANMTVRENVEIPCVSLGLPRKQAREMATAMLVRLGIGKIADQPAGTLPYTDERRVGIARALVMDPAFVLLDEPAAGMSDHECEELTTLISSIPTDFGCGVLLIEHNMAVVMKICDRVHVLDGGRTLAEGTPEQIRCSEAVMTAYLGSEM
jgi:branched-chain amino acid transport system ATP-binding protein